MRNNCSEAMEIKVINKRLKPIIFSFLPLKNQIQFASSSKEYNSIFAASLGIEQGQLHFFLKYFFIFKQLYELDPNSAYCNCFFDYDINTIEIATAMKESTKLAAIAYFINTISLNRPKYYLHIDSAKDVEYHIAILQLLRADRRFKFHCHSNINCNQHDYYNISHLRIFQFIKTRESIYLYQPSYFFEQLFLLCIKSMHDITIPMITVKADIIDQLIAYSSVYPNRVQAYHSYQKIDCDKMSKFISLNTQSLTNIKGCLDIKRYSQCSNLKDISLFYVDIPLDSLKLNFNQIKRIQLDFKRGSIQEIIKFLNKMPCLKHISFAFRTELTDKEFIKVFSSINAPNLRSINATMANYYQMDLAFLFKSFPQLKKLVLDDNLSLSKLIEPAYVYESEVVDLPIEQHEVLLRNYLAKRHKGLNLNFGKYQPGQFIDCYSSKKDIMSRIDWVSFIYPVDKPYHLPYCKRYKVDREYLPTFSHVDYVAFNYEDYYQVIEWVCKVNPFIINITPTKAITKNQLNQLETQISSLRFILIENILKAFKQENGKMIYLDTNNGN